MLHKCLVPRGSSKNYETTRGGWVNDFITYCHIHFERRVLYKVATIIYNNRDKILEVEEHSLALLVRFSIIRMKSMD